MGELVSNSQSAFLKSRCMHGNSTDFTFVGGFACCLHRKKKPAMLIKSWTSRAHSIRYLGSTYLLELLQRLAFLGEMARLDLVVAPHRIVSNPPEQ
jgi:hypothetical protein